MATIRSRAEMEYRERLAATRAADARHDEAMTRVAARGGLTLQQMRSLSGKKKDEFIFANRDGGPNDR